MSYQPTDFIVPNVFNSDASLDGYVVASQNPCKLLGFIAENTSSSTRWFQVHDAAAQPSNGAVPLISIKATTGQQVSLDLGTAKCLAMSTGLVITASSTGPTYTSVTAEQWFTVFSI